MKITATQFLPSLSEHIKSGVDQLSRAGVTPTLAIVQTKHTEDITRYVQQKVKSGAELGVGVRIIEFPDAVLSDRAALISQLQALSSDVSVHGIIFQKPSHPAIDDELEQYIPAAKDVDGFLPNSPHTPPVFRGVLTVLEHIFQKEYPDILQRKSFVVIGKGKTGGGPIIDGLQKAGIHSLHVIDSTTSTSMAEAYLKNASIVISAVGARNPVDPNFLPEQGILLDLGIHFENGIIAPDFSERDIQERMQYYTTTPGGIGALTAFYVLDNTVNSAKSLMNL